jgi:hypothetical protein
MSRTAYSDNCEGCRPVIVDLQTGKPLDDNDPAMRKILAIWETTTLKEREAYHAVMCLNSRKPNDVAVVQSIMHKFEHLMRDS